MDYKEKLKAIINSNKTPFVDIDTFLKYFPELKESEDEKVRKKLINLVKKSYEQGGYALHKWESDEMLAWLEKQGEQNPVISDDAIREGIAHFGITQYQIDNWLKKYVDVENQCEQKPQGKPALEAVKEEKVDNQNCVKSADKVEPKFHEGEWLCENEPNNYARFIQILEIVNVQGKERYRISRDIHNDEDIVEFSFVEKYYHKFDIKDAKDGDILAFKNNIGGIIICKSPTNYDTRSYCRLISDNLINKEESGWDSTLIVPATKEQREQLEKAMADAGYTFDFEKKELKKIEQDPAKEYSFNIESELFQQLTKKQQGLWRKEIEQAYNAGKEASTKWSEKDEMMVKIIVNTIRGSINDGLEPAILGVVDNVAIGAGDVLKWLKSLRPQPKQEWSEEDEKCIRLSTDIIDSALRAGFCVQLDRDRCVDWIKSLKLQRQWKPSEGQLECLGYAIEKAEKDWSPLINNRIYLTLKALKEQLEKL